MVVYISVQEDNKPDSEIFLKFSNWNFDFCPISILQERTNDRIRAKSAMAALGR